MDLPDFDLERFFAKWEFSARYMLGSSDAETLGLHELLAMADDQCLEWWCDLGLGYTEVPGHRLLREAITRLYATLQPDQIGVFSGAEEAIFAFMNVALGPGDHAVVTWPGYQSLYEIARSVGADVTLIPLRHDEAWTLRVDRLVDALRPNTRMIAINFPHNPTGSHIDRATLDQILALARERGAWLFSDEVYRFAEYQESDRLPAAADLYERAVSLGVMSKAFGLAGLRVGWIAAQNRAFIDRLLGFKHYLSICNSAPAEVLATIALRAREGIVSRNRIITARNLVVADAFFRRWQGVVDWVRPRAGTTAFPRLLRVTPIDEIAAELARSASVLLLPGTVFGSSHNHFRLGLGRRDLPTALGLFDRFLADRFAGP